MPCGHQEVHLEIHSTIEALDLVQAVTEHIARRLGFDEESLHWTAMAVRESSSTPSPTATKATPPRSYSSTICAAPESKPIDFIVSVRDQGRGFDPEAIKDPLTPENMLSTSGRGVFLIRQFMDDVSMRRAPQGGMEVRMIKRIHPAK